MQWLLKLGVDDWRLGLADTYGKSSIALATMFPSCGRNGFQRVTHLEGLWGPGFHGVLLWNAFITIWHFQKRFKLRFLSVSEPRVKVEERRREWGWAPFRRKDDSFCFVGLCRSYPQQTLETPNDYTWWFWTMSHGVQCGSGFMGLVCLDLQWAGERVGGSLWGD